MKHFALQGKRLKITRKDSQGSGFRPKVRVTGQQSEFYRPKVWVSAGQTPGVRAESPRKTARIGFTLQPEILTPFWPPKRFNRTLVRRTTDRVLSKLSHRTPPFLKLPLLHSWRPWAPWKWLPLRSPGYFVFGLAFPLTPSPDWESTTPLPIYLRWKLR